MHSKDRTMLASFGFRDPDKRDRRHDLACQYVAKPEVAAKLFGEAKDGQKIEAWFEVELRREGRCAWHVRPLIGFVDVLIRRSYRDGTFDEWEDDAGNLTDRRPHTVTKWLGIEVKITPVSVGDIIRQVRFYEQEGAVSEQCRFDRQVGAATFVVLTAFPLTFDDVAMLTNEGICHVLLGDGFDTFVEQSWDDSKTADSLEL